MGPVPKVAMRRLHWQKMAQAPQKGAGQGAAGGGQEVVWQRLRQEVLPAWGEGGELCAVSRSVRLA
jgi:hypothetical protein